MSFNMLSKDLIDYIYSKIIFEQPKDLTDDITSFHNSKNILLSCYYDKFEQIEPGEYKNWLYNDLEEYYNQNKPTMRGYSKRYIEIFRRLFILKDKTDDEIIDFIKSVSTNSVDRNINLYIGLLSNTERNQILLKNNIKND